MTENRELWQWSACDLAQAIRDKRLSCQDAVGSVVERIRAENGEINAIVDDLTEEALAEAAGHDSILAADGPLGPLHGVPVTIKENVDQAGRATPNGVAAFAGVIAPDDAPVVRNLRNAGAIVVGRTNTPEFSFRATTDNPLHGRTINPWDETRSPGGSSGGAAAATVMGFGPIAHGNDIGGSLRFPSFACGTATVRPTQGRVAAYNPSAPEERGLLAQLMSVQGAIAREVRDVRLAMEVLVRPDARDPWHVPLPFGGPPPPSPIKVAVTRNAHGYAIDPLITAAVDRAAGVLSDAGYAVEETEPPLMPEIAEAWRTNTMGEVKLLMDPAIRQFGSETIQRMFDEYYELMVPAEPPALIRALADRTRLTRAWNLFLEDYPLVLTPFLMRTLYGWNEDVQGPEYIKDIFDAAIYSFGMNYLGLPAAVVPTGLEGGWPLGVQIIGRRFREDLCLDAAEAIERSTGVLANTLWRQRG